MSVLGMLIIIGFCTLLLGLFILMMAKGYYHFEYLKRLYPDNLNEYENIFETYKNKFNNQYAQLIIFPTFQRFRNKEKDEKIKLLGDRISLFCRLIYMDLIIIIVTVLTLIFLFGV
ncbi:MAG: hypothetical protein HXX16_13430 [Bacteroidales bacterium]|nr:hypothetical protein [Bacteroidales bacterium]